MANGVTTPPNTRRKPREQTAAEDAAELILFADGFEIAFPDIARRARVVARETIWLVDMLQAERSARRAMQDARDRAVALLLVPAENRPRNIREACEVAK